MMQIQDSFDAGFTGLPPTNLVPSEKRKGLPNLKYLDT